MSIPFSQNTLLVHELQLGDKLSESVQTQRRADFSLMLAMLCEDVRSHSQFSVPVKESDATIEDEQALRARFHLGKKEKLALETLDEISLFNQSPISPSQLSDIQLANKLQPKALAFRNDVGYLESSLVSNTSLHCQQRIKSKQTVLTHQLKFNANAWLDNIQSAVRYQQVSELTVS